MQSRDFCFWLQGFFEIGGDADALTAAQTAMIRRHLELVFAHDIARSLRERPAPPVPGPVMPPAPEPVPERQPEPPPPYPPPPAPRC
jgi:hypothetical protein